MAPTRKQVEDLPGLGQASAPTSQVQGVIAFAPRNSPLVDLAQSLGGVRRELDQVFGQRLEQINQEEAQAGKIAAMKDEFKSWSELVASGKAPPSEHPAFYTAYEQQKGRVAGQQYAAFINDKMLNWEGNGSDNMSGGDLLKALPEWRKEFFSQLGPNTTNEFMTGVMAYAENSENNLMSQHIAEARRNAEDNMKTQIYNEVYGIVSDPKLSEKEQFAKIDEVYARQDFIGLRKEVGGLALQAIVDRAVETGDVALIDRMRKYSRTDAVTGQRIDVFKNTRFSAMLDKARKAAASASVSLDNERRIKEDRDRSERSRTIVVDAFKNSKDGEVIDPVAVARRAVAEGGDPVQAMQQINTINSVSRQTRNVADNDKIDAVFADTMFSTTPKPFQEALDALKEAHASRQELNDFVNTYETYATKGKGILTQLPDLAISINDYAKNLTPFGADAAQREAAAEQAQIMFSRAARKVLPRSRGKTPEQIAKDIEEEVKKADEKRKQALVAPPPDGSPFGPAPAAQQNSQKMAPNGKGDTVGTQLQEVATQAELLALSGKPRPVIDGFIASKPVMSPAYMMMARQQILTGKSDGPEYRRLMYIMSKLGIDTSDPKRAWIELLNRGQKKFFAQTQPTK